jgi:hypothetical protein
LGVRIYGNIHNRVYPSDQINSSYLNTSGPSGKPIAVVFVHGVLGDGSTWTRPGASYKSLPELLSEDPILSPKIDVFVYEYYTPALSEAPMISDLSEQLRETLNTNHIFDQHKQVIFVGHSMGGLIIRQYLLAHPENVSQVPMLYFYATPSNGSALGSVATQLSHNPQFEILIPSKKNNYLNTIGDMWRGNKTLMNIPSHCAFETQPIVSSIFVVDKESAVALCNEPADPLTGNHVEIVKPSSSKDLKYRVLADAIQSHLPKPPLVPVEAIRTFNFAGPFHIADVDGVPTFSLTPPVSNSETANKSILVKRVEVRARVNGEMANDPFWFDLALVLPPDVQLTASNFSDLYQLGTLAAYSSDHSLVSLTVPTTYGGRQVHSETPVAFTFKPEAPSVNLQVKHFRGDAIKTGDEGLKLQLFVKTEWGGRHSIDLANVQIRLQTTEIPLP